MTLVVLASGFHIREHWTVGDVLYLAFLFACLYMLLWFMQWLLPMAGGQEPGFPFSLWHKKKKKKRQQQARRRTWEEDVRAADELEALGIFHTVFDADGTEDDGGW